MPTVSVEPFKMERITERLQYAMIEALFRQGLLSKAQRQALCAAMNCENAAFPDSATRSEKPGSGGNRDENEA